MAAPRPPLTVRDDLQVPQPPTEERGVLGWLSSFVTSLKQTFRLHAHFFPAVLSGELRGHTYTEATKPSASAAGSAAIILSSDAATKPQMSDGSSWLPLGAGGGGAPTDAEYITGAAHAGLSAERVATDTSTVDVDLLTAAQAKWHAVGLRVAGPVDLVAGAVADGEFLKRVGATVVGATPSSGSGNFGTATLDFGGTPAESAVISVTGQAGIVAGSHVKAWFMKDTTVDNGVDEHEEAAALCPLAIGNIIAGTGFDIIAMPVGMLGQGTFKVHWQWA